MLQWDSNPWPPRYRCDALPTELWSLTGAGQEQVTVLHVGHSSFHYLPSLVHRMVNTWLTHQFFFLFKIKLVTMICCSPQERSQTSSSSTPCQHWRRSLCVCGWRRAIRRHFLRYFHTQPPKNLMHCSSYCATRRWNLKSMTSLSGINFL